MKARKGAMNGHHGFMNNIMVSMSIFCDEMAGLVNNGGAAEVIDLGFSKIFATFSDSILIDEVRRFLPDR